MAKARRRIRVVTPRQQQTRSLQRSERYKCGSAFCCCRNCGSMDVWSTYPDDAEGLNKIQWCVTCGLEGPKIMTRREKWLEENAPHILAKQQSRRRPSVKIYKNNKLVKAYTFGEA